MFTRIDDFLKIWQEESNNTVRVYQALTDQSLAQKVADDHRTLGRIAWHNTTTIPEIMERTGIKLTKVMKEDPMPQSADMMRKLYDMVSKELLTKIKSDWNDETLKQEDDMYGEQWTRSETLGVLVLHQTHHRGQMTILMRQAGLKVPGVYGPSYEEWSNYGGQPPAI